VKYATRFAYHNVPADKLNAIYDTNIFRIRVEEGTSLGEITDIDG